MDSYENKFTEGGKNRGSADFSPLVTRRDSRISKPSTRRLSTPLLLDYTRVEKKRRKKRGRDANVERTLSLRIPTDPFFSSFTQPRIFQYSLHFPRDVTAYRYSISSGRNRATVATLHRSPLLRRTRRGREGKRERERKKNKGTRWKMWRDRRLPLSPPLPAEPSRYMNWHP